MIPIRVAQSREYQGPMNTEQAMLMRCAMGHIPSMRRMGEMTTPNGDQHGQHRHSKNFCLTFHDFLSFRPAVIALDYDGDGGEARWVDSARIVGRSRLKSLLSP